MHTNNLHTNRIKLIMGAVILVGALVVVRLFWLQIARGERYDTTAENQYVSKSGSFDRGFIYFTTKDGATVAAATIESGSKIAIEPRRIEDAEATYEAISAIVPIDREKFFASAERTSDPYEEIAVRVSAEDAERINDLELPGVTLYRDKWRFYPGGSLASKAIGFVSYKEDTLVGSYGLESYYNDALTRSGEHLSVNFFAELFANVQSTVFKNNAAMGNIVTSIEPAVQSELERAVASVRSKWASDMVGAVVIDPHSGRIVAMAQVPTFDLNKYGDVDDVSTYANPFAQSVYEMGSIIKPVVMASAIDAGAVTPRTSYQDSGKVQVEDRTIYNFDKKGRGTASMQDVLNQSLNTGMVFVQQRMGKEPFREYLLDRFKLGERTGVDLPGEVKGIVGNLSGSNSVNYANAAFGQGLATTPLNIVRAFSALANGGYLVTPHLATAIEHENGEQTILEYEKKGPILKPETVSTMASMLVQVVDDGYHEGLPHYSVAAKTGTAQIARSGGLGYYDDRNLHSMIGYFPATHPRFVVYFFNYYPKNNGQFAIQTLADPFFSVIQFLGNYYEITPDR